MILACTLMLPAVSEPAGPVPGAAASRLLRIADGTPVTLAEIEDDLGSADQVFVAGFHDRAIDPAAQLEVIRTRRS